MDLRSLAFRVQFQGSESTVVKTDKAVDKLKKTVIGTTDSLDDMGTSLKNNADAKPIVNLNKETKGLKSRIKSIGKDVSSNIKYAKGEVDRLGKATKDGTNTKPISKFSAAFIDAGSKISNTTDKIKKQLDGVGKKIGDTGKSATKKITAPITGLATAGTKMALDLDQGIRKVSTLADTNVLPVGKIREEVRAISDSSGIAQKEIAEAAYSALSAGVDSANVMEFVRSGIDLTRAGFTDMETAIDATTTVLNAYGDRAFDISKIHDIFVQTQDKGKISVDELGKNIGRVIPTASSLGVNLDQLGASYAILTARGQNAQLATTNLNSMLDELGKSGSNADKILRKRTGKGFAQLTEEGKNLGEVLGILDEEAKGSGQSLKDMFGSGTAGSAAVTLLSEGVEGFNKSLADMNGATGKTAENAKTMEDGWLKIQRATTKAKNALIDAGSVIAPYVEVGAEKVSMLVDKFNQLDDGTKENIVKFALLAATIGPVLVGASKLIGAASTVIGVGGKLVGGITTVAGILGGPLTLAIGGVIAGGILLYKNWDTVKEKTSQAWDFMASKIEGATSKIRGFIDGLRDFAKNPITATVNIARNVKDRFVGKNKVDGSHRTGLARVPWDGYVAEVHKDEAILPKSEAEEYRRGTYKTRNNVVYNPSININVGQNVDTQTQRDLERVIKDIMAREREKFFAKLNITTT